MSENENTFDLDKGVADIADSLGFTDSEDDDIDDEGAEEESSKESIESVTEESTEETKTKEEALVKSAPASWAKEKHESWNAIPDDAKEYIELREKQMLDGIEQYKQGHQYGLYLNQAIDPYREDIKTSGVDEATAIANLFQHHRALTTGTIEQRQQALVRIGIASGVIPQEGQTAPDPRTIELQQRLSRVEQLEAQREREHQESLRWKIADEVNAFAGDPKNEYFADVSDDMLSLIKAGMDLKSAYEKAVWMNPVTRSKEIAKQMKIDNEKRVKEAETALKAKSANIKTASTKNIKTSSKLGTWDDTMKETLQRLNNV